MTRNLPARLGRLERERCDGCEELPALPDVSAVLDQAEPTRAEARALLVARAERLLVAVWPRAMRGDTQAAATALRLMERQAAALGLMDGDGPGRDGEVTADDLLRLIESGPGVGPAA